MMTRAARAELEAQLAPHWDSLSDAQRERVQFRRSLTSFAGVAAGIAVGWVGIWGFGTLVAETGHTNIAMLLILTTSTSAAAGASVAAARGYRRAILDALENRAQLRPAAASPEGSAAAVRAIDPMPLAEHTT